MRATRHNGRAGAHGAYNPKHNDREFDIKNSDHIDEVMAQQNVYWDCYQGYFIQGQTRERQFNFSEVERAYYFDKYGDHVDAQNERNEVARHRERNRTVDDVLSNVKTCPEESILQLGNIDATVDASVFAEISAEYFQQFEEKFGSHVHILDWALHLDESTPHIHERHVFDAKNQYGELCPQQDKALEELGFERPDLTKPKSKYNNRKMTFDDVCRKMFLDICKEHGLDIEMEPIYGGVSYLEKADYIVKKLTEENARLTAENASLQLAHDELVVKISDIDSLIQEVSDVAYDKACEVLTKEISDQVRNEDIDEIEKTKKWLASDERKAPKNLREYAIEQLSGVQNKLRKIADKVLGIVRNTLSDSEKKKAVTDEIAKQARPSVLARLERMKAESEAKAYESPSSKNKNREGRGER